MEVEAFQLQKLEKIKKVRFIKNLTLCKTRASKYFKDTDSNRGIRVFEYHKEYNLPEKVATEWTELGACEYVD